MYQKGALQKCVTLRSTEADYVALLKCGRMLMWLRCVLQELGIAQERILMYHDNGGG